MAAIDPSAPVNPEAEAGAIPRATLKMIREPIQGPGDDEDDSEDEDDEDYMRALLAESDSEDDEAGASDKKSKKAAALKELMESIGQGEDESDEDMEDAPKSKKGKKAAKVDEEDSEEDSDEDSEGDMEVEEFVICTLDPTKNYQQTLDITIGEDERVFFKVDGTHDIYLTGNYLIPDDQGRNTHHEVYDSEDDEEDEDYDLSPDEDELDDMEEESDDELDTLENPRITEIEDEVPALVNKKGKNKRAAEEPAETLDEIMEKSGEKLSKKQQKKLKTNEAKAAAAAGTGVPTLRDITAELLKPGRDVRDELPQPILRTDVMEMKDLKPGMVLTGTVRNVIDFGAFVDIGVHQDGLVHISQISSKFIKHPSEVLTVGDVVKVVVLDVDEKKNRISLSIKQAKDRE